MKIKLSVLTVLPLFLLESCATAPMGPTVQVMPSPNKPFQVFQQDQIACKQYAQSQVAGQAEAANQKAVGAAAVGTALGALVGAAASSHYGYHHRYYDNEVGTGAAIGAVAGAGVGVGMSQNAQLSIQQQYNNAYVQCMYSRGNQVPGAPPPMAPPVQYNAPPPPPPPPSVHRPPPPPVDMSVSEAQTRLNALGYPVGQVDGVMGTRTRVELKKFQRSMGLPATGELDSATQAALAQ